MFLNLKFFRTKSRCGVSDTWTLTSDSLTPGTDATCAGDHVHGAGPMSRPVITHGSRWVEGPARKSAGEGRCIRRTGWEDMAPSSTDSGDPGGSLTFNFFSTSFASSMAASFSFEFLAIGEVAAPTPAAHTAPSLVGTHLTSATRCLTLGAYHLTRSTCSTRTAHSRPRSAASAATSLSRRRAHASSSPLATLPCTCITPPVSALSAATAVGQDVSLSGSSPSRTRSATPTGATLRLSPSLTSHLFDSTPLSRKLRRSAATEFGFHSHAKTLATPACRSSCRV